MPFNYNLTEFLIILLLVLNVENIEETHKFCVNPMSVNVRNNTIDGLWELENSGIIFIAEDHYSYVEKFHENFPIIDDKMPQKVTEDILNKTNAGKRFSGYKLQSHYFYLNNKKSNKVLYLMGFNHVWFGCQQNMCLDSATDAVANYNTRELIVFRGKYYWTLKNDKISSPNRISEAFVGITTPLDSVTQIVNETLFFESESIWYFADNKMRIKTRIESVFPNAPKHIDCSLFSDKYKKMFIFKGDQYWVYAKSGKRFQLLSNFPESVKKLHKSFPTKIDSCFADRNSPKATFFIRWKYFSVSIQSLLNKKVKYSELSREYSFVKIFGCTEDSYAKFNGYEQYLKNYAKISDNYKTQKDPNPTNGSDAGNIPNPSTTFPDENIPILVIILVIIIMFIAFVILTSVGFVNRDKKSKTAKPESSSKSKTTKSTLKDLPSREVQSIVIQTEGLKPMPSDSSAFDWKSGKGVKNKDKSNNENQILTNQQKADKKKTKHKTQLNENRIKENKKVSPIQKSSDNKKTVLNNPTMRTSFK